VSVKRSTTRRASLVGVIADRNAGNEIRRFDNQGVSFPMAAGVSHPRPDVGIHVRPAIHRNHSRFMNHLIAKYNVARRLHDLISRIVAVREDGAHQASRDATVPQTLVLPRIVATSGLARTGTRPSRCGTVRLQLLRFRCERRKASIWRIDDKGSLLVRFSALVPVIRRTDTHTVSAKVGVLLAGDEYAASSNPGIAAHRFSGIDFVLFLREANSLCILFVGENGMPKNVAKVQNWRARIA